MSENKPPNKDASDLPEANDSLVSQPQENSNVEANESDGNIESKEIVEQEAISDSRPETDESSTPFHEQSLETDLYDVPSDNLNTSESDIEEAPENEDAASAPVSDESSPISDVSAKDNEVGLIEHSTEHVQSCFQSLRNEMLSEGDLTAKQRKQLLKKFKKVIAANRENIIQALESDYNGRSEFQTMAVDYFVPMITIKSALQHIDEWMEPESVDSFWIFWPGASQIHYCAKGVVGIIAPWNYPFYLSLMPLIGAISAGNRVLLKPSELSPRSSALLAKMIEQAFPKEVVQVVQGGVTTAQAVTHLPLDHLFFTGSSSVGKKVMAAASNNLVPVTLELGGKSPAVIHPSYSLKKAMTKILNGKMMNGGQSCFAPDYIMCPTGAEAELEQHAEQIQAKLFPTIQDNNDYGAVISESHLNELKRLVEDAREKGARIVEINPSREATTNKLPLYLIFNATDDMAVMQKEIFGPILPIVVYSNIDAAISYINERNSPLCAYYFDRKKSRIREFTKRVRAGGITINDTFYHIAQENLPFSGFGNSGMGAYHGWYSFLSFSHQKSVFHHSALSPVSYILGAPYKAWAKRLLRLLAWW